MLHFTSGNSLMLSMHDLEACISVHHAHIHHTLYRPFVVRFIGLNSRRVSKERDYCNYQEYICSAW